MRLHPKKYLNPRLTYCTRCGGDTNELMLIGIHEGIYICQETLCAVRHYGYPKGGRCQIKDCQGDVVLKRKLRENERLPASESCDKCKSHDEIVRKGGIYWKCSKCGSLGVIKKSDYADEVRRVSKVDAPDACGIDFEGDCPVCHPVEV